MKNETKNYSAKEKFRLIGRLFFRSELQSFTMLGYSSSMTDYTNTQITDPAIKKMLEDYFEVMHKQDMNLFDTVFHKDCALYSAQTGEISLRPYAVYRDVVANRKSPFETGNTRRDKVLMFDQISPTLAVVRVQLEMFGGVMQDYLNIVFIDGRWMILAKMWERVGDSPN